MFKDMEIEKTKIFTKNVVDGLEEIDSEEKKNSTYNPLKDVD